MPVMILTEMLRLKQISGISGSSASPIGHMWLESVGGNVYSVFGTDSLIDALPQIV